MIPRILLPPFVSKPAAPEDEKVYQTCEAILREILESVEFKHQGSRETIISVVSKALRLKNAGVLQDGLVRIANHPSVKTLMNFDNMQSIEDINGQIRRLEDIKSHGARVGADTSGIEPITNALEWVLKKREECY